MTDGRQATESAQVPQPAAVSDRRTQPEGVVPKQAQTYVIAGLALVILLAVLFSKNHTQPAAKPSPQESAALAPEANRQRIEALREDLNQKQEALAAQRAQQKDGSDATAPSGVGNGESSQPAQPPRDPVRDAERELEFRSRFVPNLVAVDGTQTPVQEPAPPRVETKSPLVAAGAGSTIPAPASSAVKHAPEVNLNAAHGQPYALFEGTVIDTVLVNRLVGDFAGPVKVMVTNPVYSHDGQHVVIPAGTFLLGDARKVAGTGQRRLAVSFHRMLMPDGYSVDLDQFHGLDQTGATGLSDQVNNHYLQIFGASIALGVISGAAEATTYGSGYAMNGPQMYEMGVASSMSQSGADVLDRFINILPTITIREGHRIKVYLTQDMLLPAYENHDVPGDF
ncbi:MAG: TrbI/VirB10 family protein [Acidobacteriota bacterium]